MGYDPNDPNQDSQNPNSGAGGTGDFSNPGEQDRIKASLGQGIDQLVKSRPAIAQWLAAHNGGRNLSDADKAQLFGVIQSQGIGTDLLELKDDGHFTAGTDHTGRDILSGLLLAFGPVAVVAAIPAVAGFVGSAGAGAATSGGAAATAGGGATAAAGGAAATAGGGGAAAAGGSMAVPWGAIVQTGGSLFGNLFAANMQANAAANSSATTAASAKYQADLIAKANADALAFEGKNAENAYQNNEAARQGNYGIFAARERRLGTIGDEVGLGPREIPAYVPGVDPRFGDMGGAMGAPADPSAAAPTSTNPTDDAAILAAVTKNYGALGVQPTGPGTGPTDAAYMAKQIKATGGLTPGNLSYWFGPSGRIAAELAKVGAAGATAGKSAVPPTPAPLAGPTPFMSTYNAGVPQAFGAYT